MVTADIASASHPLYERLPAGSTKEALGQLAAANPTVEYLGLFRRPRAVTWHGAGPQTLEDAVGVRAHVLVGPEVEVSPHRLKVFRTKQRFDVGGELDGFVGSRRAHSRKATGSETATATTTAAHPSGCAAPTSPTSNHADRAPRAAPESRAPDRAAFRRAWSRSTNDQPRRWRSGDRTP